VPIHGKEDIPWGTYHFCGGGETTWHGFAEKIFELSRGYVPLAVKEVRAITTEEYPQLRRTADRPRGRENFLLVGRRNLSTNNSWMHQVKKLSRSKQVRCTLMINPDDAQALDVFDGEEVKVRSRNGEIILPAEITDTMMSGVLSIPHGFGHNKPGTRIPFAEAKPGVSVNDITDIVITHIHPDHFGLVGTLKRLSGAKFYLHRLERDLIISRYVHMEDLLQKLAEWLHANGVPDDELHNLQTASVQLAQFVDHVPPDVTLNGGETISTGAFSFKVLWTPGHSPGHQSLLVKLASGRYYIFPGDALPLEENLIQKIPASNNWNNEQAMDSIYRLEHLSQLMGADIIHSHDLKKWDTLKKTPNAYQ